MIAIKQLNRKALYDYISSESYRNAAHIAISYHRAISHIANPRAKDEDILLLLAYEGDEMCGYLGALPDDWYDQDGRVMHCAWMSCLWVSPAHRGKKIAQTLLQTCLKTWDNQAFLTEFAIEVGNLYQKPGLFETWTTLQGRRWYFGSDLYQLLPPKSRFFKAIKPFLKLTDKTLNSILSGLRLFIPGSDNVAGFMETTTLSEEACQWLSQRSSGQGFLRLEAEIKWILRYPWIHQSKPTAESARYHFSSVAEAFSNTLTEIRDKNGKITGITLISVRNGHLKIPYLYHDCSIDKIAEYIRFFIRKNKIKTVTIYHNALIRYISGHNIIVAPSKKITRKYLKSTALTMLEADDRDLLQDGDGDCAFT